MVCPLSKSNDKVLIKDIPDECEGDITMQTVTYAKSLDLVQKLDLSDQMKLIDQLTDLVRQRMTAHPGHSILELQGLGKEIWQDIDAQKYVDRERASWDG